VAIVIWITPLKLAGIPDLPTAAIGTAAGFTLRRGNPSRLALPAIAVEMAAMRRSHPASALPHAGKSCGALTK
jgi:hypothetical protein